MEDKFNFDLKPIVKEYEKFFGFKLNKQPKSIFCYNRKEYDKLFGCKTQSWSAQFATKDMIVSIHPTLWEKYTSHANPSVKQFKTNIEHEVIHLFTGKIYGRHFPIYPAWLSEGISIVLSRDFGPNKNFNKAKKFVDVIDFYKDYSKPNYIEAGFLTKYLYEKYGKAKLIKLLKNAPKRNAPLKFKKLFKQIYKFDLTYEELNKRML